MKFQEQDVIEIKHRNSSALFCPQFGGRLLQWHHNGRALIYWPDHADWSKPAKVRGGNPLLFPFIARHFVNGEIGWWVDTDGTRREMPVHGFARDMPFTFSVSEDGQGIHMSLQDTECTRQIYPYAFRFEAHYRLEENTLRVELITSNKSNLPMPYYSGHHFYFALTQSQRNATTLQLPASRRQRQNPDGSLSATEPGESSYILSDPRLQDCFSLLDGPGTVYVREKESGLNLALDLESETAVPWYAVTTWTETPESDFYCVEPWLGLPNAIHHRQGLRLLPPGKSEAAVCRIKVL